MRCYVFAITKNEEDNIEDFYVMDLNYGNTKIISYGENLQLTIEGIIKTVKNNKITDNLESLPTFIL